MKHPGDPEISFVVTSRNDDHGGNLLGRMQLFLNGLAAQSKRFQLPAELILVEWNPPSNRPRLEAALSWPRDLGLLQVRVIEVAPELHRRFDHWEGLPIFQMIAKNVGIRRASGRFVLATNIDIMFSDEVFAFFASGELSGRRLCRIDRYDVPEDVPADLPVADQLDFCRNNVLRINRREGTYFIKEDRPDEIYFGRLIPKSVNRQVIRMLPKGLIESVPMSLRLWWRSNIRPDPRIPRLHTTSCGDFMLMAKEDWASLRGYPELEMFSIHIDSLLCYQAHFSGLLEHVLPDPMRIYHIEHTEGWASAVDPVDRKAKSDKPPGSEDRPVPRLTTDQLDAWIERMYREEEPTLFNRDDWGLGDETLPERYLAAVP